jgi:hypothetical protein
LYQPWIFTGEQSSLQTLTATTEKRFVVRADEKLTAFMELESATWGVAAHLNLSPGRK